MRKMNLWIYSIPHKGEIFRKRLDNISYHLSFHMFDWTWDMIKDEITYHIPSPTIHKIRYIILFLILSYVISIPTKHDVEFFGVWASIVSL